MEVFLPQGKFTVDSKPLEPVLLVAGGRAPSEGWLRRVAQTYPVWAVDRGIDICLSAAVIPEILIGDADSAAEKSWQWIESIDIPVMRFPADKDLTDLQIALAELGRRRPAASVLLTGGLGLRFDHAFSNVFSLLEAGLMGNQAFGLADESEAIFFLEGGQSFQADLNELPANISLLPLSAVCEKVRSRGVHWPLSDDTLVMNRPGGVSNRLASGSTGIEVSLGTGLLGVYFCWHEAGL